MRLTTFPCPPPLTQYATHRLTPQFPHHVPLPVPQPYQYLNRLPINLYLTLLPPSQAKGCVYDDCYIASPCHPLPWLEHR